MNTNGGEQLDALASEGHAKTKAEFETIDPHAENGSLDTTNIDIVMKIVVPHPTATEKTVHEEIDNENCTENNFLGDRHQIKDAKKSIENDESMTPDFESIFDDEKFDTFESCAEKKILGETLEHTPQMKETEKSIENAQSITQEIEKFFDGTPTHEKFETIENFTKNNFLGDTLEHTPQIEKAEKSIENLESITQDVENILNGVSIHEKFDTFGNCHVNNFLGETLEHTPQIKEAEKSIEYFQSITQDFENIFDDKTTNRKINTIKNCTENNLIGNALECTPQLKEAEKIIENDESIHQDFENIFDVKATHERIDSVENCNENNLIGDTLVHNILS